MTARKRHAYLITYVFTAYGNQGACVDDGTCDAFKDLQDPACATTPSTALGLVSVRTLLTCTYRKVVAVTS